MADTKDPFSSLGFQEDSPAPDGFVLDQPDDQLKEEPSQLLAAERGAEQGLSMGFSDELRGGLEAIPGAIQGEGDLSDLYRQYRDMERSKLKGLQEAHPYTYGGAELLSGAVGPSMGLGAGASLAKTIGRGVMAGGLTGVGTSEGDLTKGEIAPVATSAITGGALGGIAGGVGGMIGKVAGKGGGEAIAKESDILTKMRQAFQLEKGGTQLTSNEARDAASKQMLGAAEKLKGGFEAAEEASGKALGKVYKEAQESGLNLKDPVVDEMVRLKQELQNLADDITSPKRKSEVMDSISEIDNLLMQPGEIIDGRQLSVPRENITPGQLKQFREAMKARGVIAKGQGFDSFAELTGKASKISQKSSDILKSQVPGAEELSAKVSAAKGGQDILNTVNQLFERKDMRNTDQVAQLIAGLEKSGIKGQSAVEVMNVLRDKAVAAGDTELAKYIETELPKLAQQYDLSQAIGKSGLKPLGTVEGIGIRGAAMLGRAAKEAPEAINQFKSGLGIPQKAGVPSSIKSLLKKSAGLVPGTAAQRGIAVGREIEALTEPKRTEKPRIEKPVDVSRSLYDANTETLNKAASVLTTSDNTKIQDYGRSLQKAIESGNSQLKNAILFQISQDPKAREMINQ